MICESKVDKAKGQIELKGYAWAGGGNRVIRIDLTTDEGQNWCEGKFVKLTVWKFQLFSVTQILREIKVGGFRDPKTAILTYLEALILYFYGFSHF